MRSGGFICWLLVIVLVSFALRAWGLDGQPFLSDEVYAGFTADNYMERGQIGPLMPNHPNLRSVFVWTSMQLLGRGGMGLRAPSLIMGTMGIFLLGLLVRRLSGSQSAALAAALMLAFDPVHIVFSRQAIQEVHTVFFFLAGTLAFLSSYDDKFELRRPWLIAFSGAVFGLGLASKAHASFPLIVCLAVGIYFGVSRRRPSETAMVVSSLALLPFAVYLLTFLPWLARGYSLSEWVYMQRELAAMTVMHTGNPMDSMIDIRPWKWFLKPFMAYGNYTLTGEESFVTMSVGNPLVWLLVLPSSVYVSFCSYKERSLPLALLVLFFAVSYLPLALSPRPIWVLSSLAVTPFAFSLVGVSAARIAAGRKTVLRAYLALVILGSMVLYPLCTGHATKYPHLSFIVDRHNPHENLLLRKEGAVPFNDPQKR